MHIELKDLHWSRLTAVWSEPFPRVVAVAMAFLLLGLAYQVYVYLGDSMGTGAAAEDAAVIDVDMRVVANQWVWEPDVVEVPAGATLNMRIENEDPFAHGFAINELGLDQRLPGSQTTEFTFVANLEPGEYEFFCSVFCGAGHFGQRGTLVVTESDVVAIESDVTAATGEDDLPIRSRADASDELPYTEDDDGVKEFSMTIDEIMWDYGDGNPIRSYGYNAQLPGPDIRVTEGDRVRIAVTNNLPEATTVHWHGIDIEWAADGVPGVTQDPIQPGETFTYEFTAEPAGTRFYHTHGSHHGDEAAQMDMGLAGAFIVEPAEGEENPPDQDITWILTERISNGIFPIHGAIYPHVPPITVKEGERIRVRMINAGSSTFHPMHLHGHQFRVVAADGNPIPESAQLVRNTQPLLPGEGYDIEFIADNPGIWVFHCHELQHAAGGMIAVVQYEGFEAEAAGGHGSHSH